jgi:hypothetical protein
LILLKNKTSEMVRKNKSVRDTIRLSKIPINSRVNMNAIKLISRYNEK